MLRTNRILRAQAPEYYWEGRESLSIKAFFSGRALYQADGGYYAVDDSSYLVLNDGQAYSVTIESEASVESFCIFFRSGMAEEVYRSLTTPMDRLLDSPEASAARPVHFFERTYPHDTLLSPALLRLRTALAYRGRGYFECEEAWLEEQCHAIMERLLQVHRNVYKEVAALPAARQATREELYRRLHRAREYASALFDQPVTLEDMAHVAGLSQNHFLRTFKQAFRQTPHQYVVSKRLEHARKLLVETDRPITEICFSTGFESLGSFSWLFRRRMGVSPEGYRRQKGGFREARHSALPHTGSTY